MVVLREYYRFLIIAALLAIQYGCATTTPKHLMYNITTNTSAPVQQIADKVSQKIFDIKIAELTTKVPYYLKDDTLGISLKNRTYKLFDKQVKYSERFNERSTLGGFVGIGIPTLLYIGSIVIMRSSEGNGEWGHLGSALYSIGLLPIYLLVLPFSIHFFSHFVAGPQVLPEHSHALSTMITEYNQAVTGHPQPLMPTDSLNK